MEHFNDPRLASGAGGRCFGTRTGFITLLAGHPQFDVVGQASDGQQAVALCEQLLPDIVILDIRMPVLNGLRVARLLQQRLPALKVVIFSMDDSPIIWKRR